MPRKFLRLLLLLIFLGFSSYVLSASAIPATRTYNLNGIDASALPSLPKLDHVLKLENGEERLIDNDMDEEFIQRRIIYEIQDYGGTGANTDHDPKSPGGV
ncbi:hypothetical protein RIF29_05274 [Crotalaria pallida]|uniref:Uncharacterized protein n=1 Tax=Crotalaria pallida TaxID=3830 RepID=A0AAN9J1V1_CROPI